MREQLMILVEWAKKMPWFLQNLDLDDQVSVLYCLFTHTI